MLDSAHIILDQYIDTTKVSRFTFYSVEMERGENLEDLYYLCSVNNKRYVIFETDYIMNTLNDVAQEAKEIFARYDLTPLHWVVKKGSGASANTTTIPITTNVDNLRESLVFDKSDSLFSYNLRYAVIEFIDAKGHKKRRYDPNTYGYSTK